MEKCYQNIAVVIPAYNESNHITAVVKEVKNFIRVENIFVVDDGSDDGTGGKAAGLGVKVISHERNYGKGRALITGLNEIKNSPDISAVITLDGDGQHNPSYIPEFITKFFETGADIIIGNRMNKTALMPAMRRVSNKITSLIISRLTGLKIPDSQSGYRLISTSIIRNIYLKRTHFETESELILKAVRKEAKIDFIYIDTIYSDEKSKMNPFIDTYRFLSLVFRSFFW